MIKLEKTEPELISETPDLVSGLSKPSIRDWIEEPPISSDDVIGRVRERAPTSSPDVVKWMQDSAAELTVLRGMSMDYSRNDGKISTAGGDGNIPGVAESGMFNFRSWSGGRVRREGYALLNAPGGPYRVPTNGSTTVIVGPAVGGGPFLGWAGVPGPGSWIQWRGVLARFKELASRPVTKRVRHPCAGGLVSPLFFMVSTRRLFINAATVNISSNKPQTLQLTLRNPSDYTDKITEFEVDIPKGTSRFRYRIYGGPRSLDHVLQIQPENNTKTIVNSII